MCASFSSAIGTPQVALTIGNRTRYASFSSVQGQHTHDRDRVQSGDLGYGRDHHRGGGADAERREHRRPGKWTVSISLLGAQDHAFLTLRLARPSAAVLAVCSANR